MQVSPVMVPIVLFTMIPITVIGAMLVRAYTKRLELGSRRTELSPELAERLDRMEQAMDAIAVEVERISEAQRFTTRLLSERSAGPAALGGGQGAGR